MLLALKSLHSALDKVTYDPRIDVFNGDTVHDIARHTGMKGASRLAQVNRNSRSAVQQLNGVEVTQFLYNASISAHSDMEIYRSPVKSSEPVFAIQCEGINLGYININTEGAMMTVFTYGNDLVDRYQSISIQGIAQRIKDSDSLSKFIKKSKEFWNAYGNAERPEKPEYSLIQDYKQRTQRPKGPFDEDFEFDKRIFFWISKFGYWHFEYQHPDYTTNGVFDLQSQILWAETEYQGTFENDVDDFFQGRQILWSLYSMKLDISSSEELNTHITTFNWIDPSTALFVCPCSTFELINWKKHIQPK